MQLAEHWQIKTLHTLKDMLQLTVAKHTLASLVGQVFLTLASV